MTPAGVGVSCRCRPRPRSPGGMQKHRAASKKKLAGYRWWWARTGRGTMPGRQLTKAAVARSRTVSKARKPRPRKHSAGMTKVFQRARAFDVVDTPGSREGDTVAQCARPCGRIYRTLNPTDMVEPHRHVDGVGVHPIYAQQRAHPRPWRTLPSQPRP